MDIYSDDDDICEEYKPAICRHRYIIIYKAIVKDHHEHHIEYYQDHHDVEHHHDHYRYDADYDADHR